MQYSITAVPGAKHRSPFDFALHQAQRRRLDQLDFVDSPITDAVDLLETLGRRVDHFGNDLNRVMSCFASGFTSPRGKTRKRIISINS